jgi:hypothetical protein
VREEGNAVANTTRLLAVGAVALAVSTRAEITLGALCVRSAVQEAGSQAAREQTTLDRAVALAGLKPAHLPIILTSTLPPTLSPNAEAWTVFDEACRGQRIFVYTRTAAFECAGDPNPLQRQCVMKVASIVVHEAWHLRHGPDEAEAYRAQLLFLQMIEATAFQQVDPAAATEIAAIRRARDRVLAEKRKARKTTGRGSGEHTCQHSTIYSPN